jgi:hypothetical protein
MNPEIWQESARRGTAACSVETHYGAWLVTFDTGVTLLLQSDYDQAAFAVSCGAIKAPENWDGSPSKLGDGWALFDPSIIEACPREYWEGSKPEPYS